MICFLTFNITNTAVHPTVRQVVLDIHPTIRQVVLDIHPTVR